MIPLLGDEEVAAGTDARTAVDLMRLCVVESAAGRMQGPPRHVVGVGGTDLTLAAGGLATGACGLRVYGGWGKHADQATLAWSATGTLLGVVVGGLLGVLRTGALGGVALQAARPRARRVGVLGCGDQAWGQVWAAAAVLELDEVLVFSPTHGRAEQFAQRVQRELEVPCRAARSAEDAVRENEVVILATNSTEPVLSRSWLVGGAHVTTLGSRLRGHHDAPLDLLLEADVVVSDAPQQLAADGAETASRAVLHLGHLVEAGPPAEGDTSVYVSAGLAGTEPVLAAEVIRRWRRGSPPPA